jgi:hypothetical protein
MGSSAIESMLSGSLPVAMLPSHVLLTPPCLLLETGGKWKTTDLRISPRSSSGAAGPKKSPGYDLEYRPLERTIPGSSLIRPVRVAKRRMAEMTTTIQQTTYTLMSFLHCYVTLYNHDAYYTKQQWVPTSSSPALPELPADLLVAFFRHTEFVLFLPSSSSDPCEPDHQAYYHEGYDEQCLQWLCEYGSAQQEEADTAKDYGSGDPCFVWAF